MKAIGGQFVAFCIEVQGRWGKQAQKLFNQLANQLALANGTKLHVVKNYWTRRLSCTLRTQIAEAQQFKAAKVMAQEITKRAEHNQSMVEQLRDRGGGYLSGMQTCCWETEDEENY